MKNINDLGRRINAKYKSMSKGHRLLAAYITDNYDKAAFLTAAKLGEAVGVSESTVVRFASNLGYRGYPDFQKELEEQVRNRLCAVSYAGSDFGRNGRQKVLDTVLRSDAKNIRETAEQMDGHTFALAVDTILNARNIYIIGIRSCASLAAFLAFYLDQMFDGVRLLNTTSISEIFEQMIRIGEEDVIIGISFPRYSMRTLKAIEFANNRSVRVITLTDSVHSPMNLYSSCNLIAKSKTFAAWDSLTAPLSVINALTAALYAKKKTEVADRLEQLEEIWEEYQVYGGDEIEPVEDSIKMRYAEEMGEST